jgi:hypothetical protein
MQFINTIKDKFNNTKEWIVDHKELLLTDAAILAGCAGAIGVAVAVSKNEDKKAAEAQQAIIEDAPISEEEYPVLDTTTDVEEQFFNNDEPVEETINEEIEA